MTSWLTHVYLICLVIIFSSCAAYLNQPLQVSEARLGSETANYQKLSTLPPPQEKIVAAVYKFRDQTGQYKPTDVGSSWSTAVTQGATSILLRSLEESNWFVVIEREGLTNLLNERKIIRSSRANYGDGQQKEPLPPLIFAGILLEGGIISFDSNIQTGGIGVRYFGTGGSGQYREDRVTIYLRAVSTSNGRVLKTIYTSKTILSQQVDVGVFRFVSLKRLLEAETGFTYNEPSEMAVREAIEKAVEGLIIEGVVDGLWSLKNEEDRDVVDQYLLEKNNNKNRDLFGSQLRARRGVWGFGASGSGLLYEGDLSGSRLYPGGDIHLEYKADKPFSGVLNLGAGKIGTDNSYKGVLSYAELGAKYKILSYTRATPYIRGGIGGIKEISSENVNTPGNDFHMHAVGEFGLEYLVTDKLGLNSGVNYRYTLTDNLDGVEQGKYKDYFWGFNLGLTYYFQFKKKAKKKGG